jgi:hypothetical protein
MTTFPKLMSAAGAAILFSLSTAAVATPFQITAASFEQQSGYGIDANENSETLLDVRFSTVGTFTPQMFNLNAVNQSYTFNFGTVNFQEPGSMNGITSNETDFLGVTAKLTFTDPTNTLQSILATGTATTGSVSDVGVDYSIVWDPVSVAFGNGGLFDISFANLSFAQAGSQTQTATITLRSLSQVSANEVPEPASFASLGLGLAAFAGVRRKK